MTKKETKKIMTNTKWIAEQLLALGMNQKDLSERIGLDPGAMSRTIAGRRRLQISEANKIATLFGTSLMDVLENFGIADPGVKTEIVPIILAASKHGDLAPLPGKDTVPSLPSFPDAKYVAQWREPGSPFDGWLFFVTAISTDIELTRLAAIHLENGKSVLGVLSKSYVPGRYRVSPQGGEPFESAVTGMRPVLAIIPA
jgi:DNA-binding XRE family transcriptional regulator